MVQSSQAARLVAPLGEHCPVALVGVSSVDQSREFNGATDGATAESRRHGDRMNIGSAADWEVMIEHVRPSQDVFGRPGQFHRKPQIVDSTGVFCFLAFRIVRWLPTVARPSWGHGLVQVTRLRAMSTAPQTGDDRQREAAGEGPCVDRRRRRPPGRAQAARSAEVDEACGDASRQGKRSKRNPFIAPDFVAEGLRADKPEGRGKSSIERQVPVDSEDDISRVASLLHAQRHVDPSITTLAAQDATVGCAADRLLRRGNS